MCLQLLPLLATAAGTAVQTQNQAHTDRERTRENERSMRANAELRGRTGQRVNEEIQKVAVSNSDKERAQAQGEFMEALRRAKLDSGGTDLGGGGDQFMEDTAASGAAQSAENVQTADTLARIDAPVRQREREARGFGNLSTDLSVLHSEAGGQDFLTRLRQSLIRPDAGMQALGSGLQAFGSAYGQRAQPTKPVKYDTTQWVQDMA